MELLKYVRSHPSWETELAAAPYNLNIIKSGDYILFKYPDKDPNFKSILVREAHGAIIRFDNIMNMYICVNFPFEKFFSYDTPFAKKINWPEAHVEEKIDGLLVCAWSDQGTWHFSTRTAITLPGKIEEEMKRACGGAIENLTKQLNPLYCYSFMLTSPNYKLVIDYGKIPKIWYIARRNLGTLLEESDPHFEEPVNFVHPFPRTNNPKILTSIQEFLEPDETGFVVTDDKFNRVYFDGDFYAIRAQLKRAPVPSTADIIRLWQNGQLEDYEKFFPEDTDRFPAILRALQELIDTTENKYQKLWVQCGKNKKKFLARCPTRLVATRKYFLLRQQDTVIYDIEKFFKEECTAEELAVDVQSLMAIHALQEVMKK